MTRENVYLGASELLQFAVRIEENGEKFYRKVAETSKDKKIGEMFAFLAREEAEHKDTFEGMIPEIEKYEPSETYPPEYFTYLRAYADNIVFTAQIDKDLPEQEKVDPVSAIDFGLRREFDSIAYYKEMIGFVPAKQQDSINKVIEEERKHVVKLSELKETLQEGEGNQNGRFGT